MSTRHWVLAAVGVALLVVGTGCTDKGVSTEDQYVYTVQEGDGDFQAIARRVYGDAGQAAAIQKANPSLGVRDLTPGTKLMIPPMMSAEGKMVAPKECDKKAVY